MCNIDCGNVNAVNINILLYLKYLKSRYSGKLIRGFLHRLCERSDQQIFINGFTGEPGRVLKGAISLNVFSV